MKRIKCEDRNCTGNNGYGECTNERVNKDPNSCMGRRVPGGEWQRKYLPNQGVTPGVMERERMRVEEP